MSEYGFQGYPDISTISSFTLDTDREVDSDVMRTHQKHPRGIELVKKYMERDYKAPKDFISFLYVSQLLQAEGIKTAIEAHRRAKPYCMGTLYWQLNDCWPVASWSGVDYFGRWKAMHYFVRDAYKTFLISVAENDEELEIYVVSDSINEIDATLEMKLMTFEGEDIFDEEIQMSIPPLSSQIGYSVKTSDILNGVKKDGVFLMLNILHHNSSLSKEVYYFTKPKRLALLPEEISSNINKVNDHWKIELSSSRLIKNVYLRVDGDDGFFSDNYFDLMPGEIKLVKYFPGRQEFDFSEKLLIHTLNHSYR